MSIVDMGKLLGVDDEILQNYIENYYFKNFKYIIKVQEESNMKMKLFEYKTNKEWADTFAIHNSKLQEIFCKLCEVNMFSGQELFRTQNNRDLYESICEAKNDFRKAFISFEKMLGQFYLKGLEDGVEETFQNEYGEGVKEKCE